MLSLREGILISEHSGKLQVTMLIYLNLILIGLHLVHELFCGLRRLDHRIDVALIIPNEAIVVLSQLLQFALIHLYLSFHLLFALPLLRVDKDRMQVLILLLHLIHFATASQD